MISPTTSAIDMVKSYCQENQKAPDFHQFTLLFQGMVPSERWTLIQAIDREFLHKQSDPEKVKLFKKSVCREHEKSWKTSLLNCRYQTQLNVYKPFLDYSNDLKKPLNQANRLLNFSHQECSAIVGSTFATNKPQRLNKKGHSILDSLFACKCDDGFALAVGDGAGGHLGDAHQDEQIAKAAHSATKTAGRLFAAYHNPEELLNQISSIVGLIAKEVKRKSNTEGTTLVACRTFTAKEGVRIIGFNIGDGMLVGWDPATNKVYPLLSSYICEGGTAFLPGAYKAFDIQIVDTVLPENSVLFLMSDGIHEYLPCSEQKGKYPNELGYQARTLSNLEVILENVSPKDAHLAIVKSTFAKAEETRQGLIKQSNVYMGDDLTILQCSLGKEYISLDTPKKTDNEPIHLNDSDSLESTDKKGWKFFNCYK